MAFELDQSTYLDAEDEPLDLFRHSDLMDDVDFLPDEDDDGGDEDGVFADSMDYQVNDDDMCHEASLTRPFDAPHDNDDAMRANSDPPSHDESNNIPSSSDAAELEAKYCEALRKLAESMQRTEVSRRQVIMHRHMLTPEQIFALEMAKEQLRHQQHLTQFAAVAQQRDNHRRPSREGRDYPPMMESTTNARSLSPGRPSIMDAFFSGSRGGNLTNGIDQSRAQLGTYMGQMNQRIFWG
jgi:hypothetical protein